MSVRTYMHRMFSFFCCVNIDIRPNQRQQSSYHVGECHLTLHLLQYIFAYCSRGICWTYLRKCMYLLYLLGLYSCVNKCAIHIRIEIIKYFYYYYNLQKTTFIHMYTYKMYVYVVDKNMQCAACRQAKLAGAVRSAFVRMQKNWFSILEFLILSCNRVKRRRQSFQSSPVDRP